MLAGLVLGIHLSLCFLFIIYLAAEINSVIIAPSHDYIDAVWSEVLIPKQHKHYEEYSNSKEIIIAALKHHIKNVQLENQSNNLLLRPPKEL